ncbi:hypothetical protein Poly30_45100 [Planctomycetes bacterium Poly30]|uniref:Uncharacterized protein n=1 Tax=Saltatorellus ferox TaxID=2528018 RepID=A0A518EXY6_9BACT|nr:hypothetical protein Poly30_45100 [Planctomycetes bacterium Poly30]
MLRSTLAPQRFAAAMVLALALGCGEPIPPTSEAPEGGIQPLVTIAMSEEHAEDWTLPEGKARIQNFLDRIVLFLDRSEAEKEISHRIPTEARGAGFVALRVMSDFSYRVGLQLGATEVPAIEGGNTRREWRELMFALPGPLTFDEGDRVTFEFGPTTAPVLIEAIRFLP